MPALNYNSNRFLWPLSANSGDTAIIDSFKNHVSRKSFPCIAAKAALGLDNIDILVAGHLACPADDTRILSFLYDFTERLRNEPSKFRSATVLFRDDSPITETQFDHFMWNRLRALTEIDRIRYRHDPRVSSDPASPEFSYSLKEEAFYVIGMHAESSRVARQFAYPALVFNPHIQFDELRKQGKYEAMRSAIRKRDLLYSGSVNPMLNDFGSKSEAIQYSGMAHESGWICPLKQNQKNDEHYSPA